MLMLASLCAYLQARSCPASLIASAWLHFVNKLPSPLQGDAQLYLTQYQVVTACQGTQV